MFYIDCFHWGTCHEFCRVSLFVYCICKWLTKMIRIWVSCWTYLFFENGVQESFFFRDKCHLYVPLREDSEVGNEEEGNVYFSLKIEMIKKYYQ